MSEIILTPLPIENGVLTPGEYRDVINLVGNKFIAIYSQNNPNYVFCTIFEVIGMKTGAPTYNIIRTQVLNEYTPATATSFRLCKLTESRIMVLMNSVSSSTNFIDISILEIDPSTNVITKASNNAVSLGPAYVGNILKSGSYSGSVTYKRINDTVAFVSIPGGANNYIRLYKITYDLNTKLLSDILLWSNTGSTTGYRRLMFYDHADNSGFTIVAYTGSRYQSYRTDYGVYVGYPYRYIIVTNSMINDIDNITSLTDISGSGTWIYTYGVAGSTGGTASGFYGNGMLFKDSFSNGIYFRDNYRYYPITATSAGSATNLKNYITSSTVQPHSVIPIDDQYCLLLTSVDGLSSSFRWYSRMRIRIVDYNSYRVTSNTQNNIETRDNFFWNKLSFVEKLNSSTIVLYGMTATSATDTGSFHLMFLYVA